MTGGDIEELTYNHPTLGTGVFDVKSDEDSELDLGDYKSADEEKSISSSGEMIDIMTKSRWSASCVVASDLTNPNHLAKLQALMSSPVLAVWTITHISGAIYRGKGKPVGDLKQGVKPSTVQLKLAGGGKLAQVG
jgi:hypothetical protein